jgi:CheY-like chemotaxis protein
MHGGILAVDSSGEEGAGSTFSFTLPIVQSPTDRARRLSILPKNEQTVMVLTNHPGSSERLCEQLNRRGFKVQISSMDLLSSWQSQLFELLPDAVLLDVGIASNLGWDVLKAIKGSQTSKEIPVLFYKSSQDDGSVLELDYLTKPIELAELTRALDQHWLMANVDHSARTILVVDDEPNTLDMHARIVQSHSSSNHVLKARNGREALEILESEIIDLVLLDLQMPEMDGFGVLERMRENEGMRKIPVIVMTGKILTEADMARLNRGVAAILEKGLFSLDETVTHISAALERKRRLSGEAQRLVRKAMAFIHEHFADSISRRNIAHYVSISEDHLTFCFRQELGTTPIEYLQRYRVNQAKRLLKDSERTITEIALDVGFSDSGYFSRIFRRTTGMSPEAFRRG